MTAMTYQPVALVILDGWGIREFEHANAVVQAATPNYDRWLAAYERAILDASGEAVGLPRDQMGNSEVGHLNLGAGRIVFQDLTRIDMAIANDELAGIEALREGVARAREAGGQVHLVGLLGEGGVHSHDRHLYALLEVLHGEGVSPVVHVITDGRDTPPQSAAGFARSLSVHVAETGGVIASVTGRYYAMDRDKRWARTAVAYDAIVAHQAERSAPTAEAAIEQSYEAGASDEFIQPTIVDTGDRDVAMTSHDTIIFYNFRADRMRQIVAALTREAFEGFERSRVVTDASFITMTSYEEGLPVAILFPEQTVVSPLAQVISRAGLSQFHAAETEKYAHVTYFFNGGVEPPFPGEERELTPSPQVATYDLKPEMSAYELTESVLARLASDDDAFILVNYANPDMVGHTGDLAAATAACAAVDECAGRLVTAVLDKGGVALVTADHGNAEIMLDEITGRPHTYHTTNPVSFIAIADRYMRLYPRGILADVAPTVLALLGLEQPPEMTGRSLIAGVANKE